MNTLCYCDSECRFVDCCEPILRGERVAASPLELMRSRYTAFCLKQSPYLIDTHHLSTRSSGLLPGLESTLATTTWLGLRILNHTQKATTGTVEFVAFFHDNQMTSESPKQLREISEFVLDNGHWFYIKGQHLPPIKMGRNDICWCGSGKKLKKCHSISR